jgi:hypothetical protein
MVPPCTSGSKPGREVELREAVDGRFQLSNSCAGAGLPRNRIQRLTAEQAQNQPGLPRGAPALGELPLGRHRLHVGGGRLAAFVPMSASLVRVIMSQTPVQETGPI